MNDTSARRAAAEFSPELLLGLRELEGRFPTNELAARIVPFFDRFPIVGAKAQDYRLWKEAVLLLRAGRLSDQDYHQVLALRERMNRGGKRRHRMDGILRDYTPGPSI